MTDHERWMREAIRLARESARDGDGPVAALVVRDGEVLATGRNTKSSEECGFAHAELNALVEAKPRLGRRPDGAVMYVTLEPCAMCLGAISFAGIGTLVYGARDREGGAVAMFDAHPFYRRWLPHVIGAVLEPACEALRRLPEFGRGGRD